MWTKNPHNEVLQVGPNCFVSYCPDPMIWGKGPETAIVFKESDRNHHFILKGDWRREYEEAAKADGVGGVMRVFQQNREEHLAGWSDDASFEERLKAILGVNDDA